MSSVCCVDNGWWGVWGKIEVSNLEEIDLNEYAETNALFLIYDYGKEWFLSFQMVYNSQVLLNDE